MKKVLLFLVLLVPFIVKATDECDDKNISIEKVEFVKTNGNAVELSDAKIENQVIKFDISFSKLDDSVEYKVLLKNNSDEDYQIDQNSIKSESEYVSYVINNGEPMVLGAKEEKKISILVKYDKKVDGTKFVANVYDVNNKMTFNLVNNEQENPLTKTSTIIAIVMVLLAAVVLIVASFVKSKKLISLALVLLLVPFVVNAMCKMTINTDSHFVIEKYPNKRCYYDGELTKGAEYTNGQYVYRYLEEATAQIVMGRFKDIDEGWSMRLVDRDSTDPVTTEMCVYINDIPVTSMAYIFGSSSTSSVDLSSFNTTNIVSMQGAFRGTLLEEVDLSYLDTSNVKTMHGMFALNEKLKHLDITSFDTRNVEDMTFMFGYLAIDDIDLSHLDTSKVKTMYQMFSDAKIDNLDLSAWNTSSLENMRWMFYEFEGQINFGNFNTSNVTNMEKTFFGAKIPNLDVSSFDTRKVTNMLSMFEGLDTEIIDVSNFQVDSLESVHRLFAATTAKTIDISGMNTNTLRKITNMFVNASNLETIYASPDFDYNNITDYTANNFMNNYKLKGEKGTVCEGFSSMSYERQLMRIDNAPDAPGCFSAK